MSLKKEHMRLGEKRDMGFGEDWRRVNGSRFDQNILRACMQFSSHEKRNNLLMI